MACQGLEGIQRGEDAALLAHAGDMQSLEIVGCDLEELVAIEALGDDGLEGLVGQLFNACRPAKGVRLRRSRCGRPASAVLYREATMPPPWAPTSWGPAVPPRAGELHAEVMRVCVMKGGVMRGVWSSFPPLMKCDAARTAVGPQERLRVARRRLRHDAVSLFPLASETRVHETRNAETQRERERETQRDKRQRETARVVTRWSALGIKFHVSAQMQNICA
jgi:hypothetical protein